jgi:hypothetical protein
MMIPLNEEKMMPAKEIEEGILSMTMYYYKTMRDLGFSVHDAKEHAAKAIETAYYKYCENGSITPKSLGSVEKKLERVTETVKEEAKSNPALRSAYQNLLSIQKQVKR